MLLQNKVKIIEQKKREIIIILIEENFKKIFENFKKIFENLILNYFDCIHQILSYQILMLLRGFLYAL